MGPLKETLDRARSIEPVDDLSPQTVRRRRLRVATADLRDRSPRPRLVRDRQASEYALVNQVVGDLKEVPRSVFSPSLNSVVVKDSFLVRGSCGTDARFARLRGGVQ